MRRLTDGQLVAKATAGDDSAFDELVSRYRTRVYHLALSRARARENALDIAQEAFVQAYLSLRTLRQPERFNAWLSAITANLCKMHFRQSTEVPIAPEMIEDMQPLTELDPNAALAREALDQLPNGTRSAAILYFIEEMKQTQIAEFLGISLAAVKSRIRDARASLQKEMIHMVKQTTKQEGDGIPEEAPVIRIAYTIIQQAIVHGATDILLEPKLGVETDPQATQPEVLLAIEACKEPGALPTPGGPGMHVGIKVNDSWQELMLLPDYLLKPITERFKLMADVDLHCTDRSQEGRTPIHWGEKYYDLRLSTTPTSLGERLAVRVGPPTDRPTGRPD